MKKEIEKRFLLKRLPIIPTGFEIQNIIQYYYLDGVWKRIRKIDSLLNGVESVSYLHTIKTYIEGVCYEEEENYSYESYQKLIKEIHSSKYETLWINKTRYLYNTGVFANFEGDIKEIKWEIDSFSFDMVIAEIELPSMDFEITIPKFIEQNLVYEVTGIKQFSNRYLAENIPS